MIHVYLTTRSDNTCPNVFDPPLLLLLLLLLLTDGHTIADSGADAAAADAAGMLMYARRESEANLYRWPIKDVRMEPSRFHQVSKDLFSYRASSS